MELPPGPKYIFLHLPYILGPPLLTYLLFYAGETYFEVTLPGWVRFFSMLASFPAALSAVVLGKDLYIYWDAKSKGAVLPPNRGKDRSPGSIMTLVELLRNAKTHYPGDAIFRTAEEVGGFTFTHRMLFENRIFTADPEYIKAMLATQFDTFQKGPEVRSLLANLLGTGVFAVDGDLWKFHRSMTRPFFTRDRISHFENFDRHAEVALNQLKARLRDGYPVDFQDLVARFTLDSATEFLFGDDVESLSAGLPYPFYASQVGQNSSHPSTKFAQAFSEAQIITSSRSRYGLLWPFAEFWKDKLKEPMSVVHSFIDPIIADALANKENMKTAGIIDENGDRVLKDDETLLEHLVRTTEDPVIVRDEIMSLLVAGRDTTASTLTFVIYMLAEHPEVLRKLREEILDKIGPNRRPSYEDFRDMKYLRAVINETLRLYPVVPFNMRASNQATIWPSTTPGGKPFYIPANTRTPYSVFVMHRRTDLWGPDAQVFDPERFIDERLHKYLTPNPFIFLPFNAGPRICLGQQFAYNESSFFLVRLLQQFSSIALAPDAQPLESRPPEVWSLSGGERKRNEKIRPKTHLTMYVQDGLWVRMEEVKGDAN